MDEPSTSLDDNMDYIFTDQENEQSEEIQNTI